MVGVASQGDWYFPKFKKKLIEIFLKTFFLHFRKVRWCSVTCKLFLFLKKLFLTFYYTVFLWKWKLLVSTYNTSVGEQNWKFATGSEYMPSTTVYHGEISYVFPAIGRREQAQACDTNCEIFKCDLPCNHCCRPWHPQTMTVFNKIIILSNSKPA